jgi:hypothetical protein
MSRKFWFGFIGLVALLSLVLIISRQLGRPAVHPADNLINDVSILVLMDSRIKLQDNDKG